jgi:GAF domain-containing protein
MSELSRTTAEESTRVLQELNTIVLGREPLNPTLQRVADIARRAIPGVDDVSVTLLDGGERVRTVVFTSTLAVELDERQYAAGFGPCLDAAAGGATIVVDMDDPDTPYPDFARAARRAGVDHTISVGLPMQDHVAGALNLYARQAGHKDERTVALAPTFAGYAGAVVTNAAQYSSAAELAEQMQQAMTSRAMIEQAKGILMAQHGCSSDTAFLELTRISQRSNRKLRDVAASLVSSVSSNGRRPG